MIKAVIFDLDDTLISEREYIESGYHFISRILEKELDKDENKIYEELIDLFKINPKYVFNRLLDNNNIKYTQDYILNLVKQFRNHDPDIKFYDDVIPCIKYLKSKGIKLGIITDGFSHSQKKKLDVVKASDYFDEIIVTGDLGEEYWKPHTKSYEIMRNKLNIKYNEMIYVGDNPKKDFYISKIYPIKTMKVKRTNGIYKRNKYYKNIKDNFRINSLYEIIFYV